MEVVFTACIHSVVDVIDFRSSLLALISHSSQALFKSRSLAPRYERGSHMVRFAYTVFTLSLQLFMKIKREGVIVTRVGRTNLLFSLLHIKLVISRNLLSSSNTLPSLNCVSLCADADACACAECLSPCLAEGVRE